MIQNWCDNFLGTHKRLRGNERRVAEAAREGIIKVGKMEDCSKETLIRTNKEFNRVMCKSRGAIVLYCIQLYMRNIFVNRVVNQALRDNDDGRSEMLGPFCYLLILYIYSPSTPLYIGTVYRECSVEPSVIEEYRQAIGNKGSLKWLGFTSTSKNETIAKEFSNNVLFKIELKNFGSHFRYGRPVDISELSEMAQEDEVLLPAGFLFYRH